MQANEPRYELLASIASAGEYSTSERANRWRFELRQLNGHFHVEADDYEDQASTDRLELLSVVRGLEALDQPSSVTLITPSRYVRRGLRFGLSEWRLSRFRWERFGRMVPIENEDLWRRVDRALRYHRVECRALRLDTPEQADSHGNPVHPVRRPYYLRSRTQADSVADRPGRDDRLSTPIRANRSA